MQYLVCKESLQQAASRPINVYPIKHRVLRNIGIFNRKWEIDGNGISHDVLDGRPFSTNFAFTRFAAPHYSRYLGTRLDDPSVFMDSDMVCVRDPYTILDEIQFDEHPVWCVKHNYKPTNLVKMDGQPQVQTQKKLWSSFMIFNLRYPKCGPSIEDVNTKDGAWLHSFSWLKDKDIGELNEGWNFIPDHSEARVKNHEIGIIHYTEGSPALKPGCKYSAVYQNYLRDVLSTALEDDTTLGEM